MKRQFSFLWVAFAILVALSGCGPYIPTDATVESALVKVECRDEPSVRQRVLELLRFGRGKDIAIRADGGFLQITAAFTPAQTPSGRLAQILEDLNAVGGVTHTEMVENPRPIRQNF